MTEMLEPVEEHPPTEGSGDFVRHPREEDIPAEPSPGLSPTAGETPPDTDEHDESDRNDD